jgi:hypothetical protein
MATTTNMVKPTAQQAQASGYEAAQGEAQGYIAQASEASTGTAQGYEGAQGTASTYESDQREVGSNATVKGQLEGLLSEGSKYLDIARQGAAEQANKRGFLNSTMAAGAGERAAIQSALPIASQDASTYHNQSLTNQNAENQSRQYNAGNEQQMDLANMQSENQANQFTAQQQNAMEQFNAGQTQQNSQFNAQQGNAASEFTASQENAMTQANMNSQNQAGQFNATAEQQASEFNASQANQMLQQQWSQESAQAHEEIMANLNASLEQGIIDAKAFANLRGQYLDSFTSVVNEANINISEIQSNENIPAAEKTKMIQNQIKMRDADLKAMKTLFEGMPMWQQNWNALA